MGFKDSLMEDMDEVFFDAEEFGSEHEVDGHTAVIVMADMDIQDAKAVNARSRTALNPKETSIAQDDTTFFIREKDLHRRLTANAVITFDGKKMFVSEAVRTDDGMWRVSIRRHMN